MAREIIALANILGVQFRNLDLLEQAMTHRSFLNESKEQRSSNERLEFLGDAILSFVVSQHLFTSYPNLPEGELTNLRSATVKTTTLSDVALKLKVGNFLLLSRGEEEGGGRTNTSLLADAFEAIIGAIYLDQGLPLVKTFLAEQLFSLIPEIIRTRSYVDFKSDFQEKVQARYRSSPVYKVVNEEGPDHAKVFHVAVYVASEEVGSGQGKSKQEAEQEAAKVALEKW